MGNLKQAIRTLEKFSSKSNLTKRISEIESTLKKKNRKEVVEHLEEENINKDTLDSAFKIKDIAGQINVIVHAIGVLTALRYILSHEEKIISVSLGAGNTGKKFDLETDKRVAEFKFIQWQGGPEAIRQNSIFKDFFYLSECNKSTDIKRCLYVLNKQHPIRFLKGKRSIKSIVSKNRALSDDFFNKYGTKYSVVSEYYHDKKSVVDIIDLKEIMPILVNEEHRPIYKMGEQ